MMPRDTVPTPFALTRALWAMPDPLPTPWLTRMAPWQLLDELSALLALWGNALGDGYTCPTEGVWVHHTARISPDVVMEPPCLVCAFATLRTGAYLRGSVYVGAHATVGHCTEVKNSILMAESAAPHFNYVGDSILGVRAHLGAGVVLSNLRHDQAPVEVRYADTLFHTARRKLGALLGDRAEVGCNAVLNPGTVMDAGAVVHPLQSAKGHIRAIH